MSAARCPGGYDGHCPGCTGALPAGQQPGACSTACVHLMEAATLSARLGEADELLELFDRGCSTGDETPRKGCMCHGCRVRRFRRGEPPTI